jgi:hypothetical protein
VCVRPEHVELLICVKVARVIGCRHACQLHAVQVCFMSESVRVSMLRRHVSPTGRFDIARQ